MSKVLTIILCLLCVVGGAAVGMNYDRIAPHISDILQIFDPGPDDTAAPTLTPTPTKTPTPMATSTPVPAGTKEIVDTWIGSKTINLFIVKESADFRVVFRVDNTTSVTGTLDAPGYDNVPFAKSITGSYLGSSQYRGTYGSTSIVFVVKGDVMTMTVNPYDLGLTTNKFLDMPINVELRKI